MKNVRPWVLREITKRARDIAHVSPFTRANALALLRECGDDIRDVESAAYRAACTTAQRAFEEESE